jgi:hypothetical protein
MQALRRRLSRPETFSAGTPPAPHPDRGRMLAPAEMQKSHQASPVRSSCPSRWCQFYRKAVRSARIRRVPSPTLARVMKPRRPRLAYLPNTLIRCRSDWNHTTAGIPTQHASSLRLNGLIKPANRAGNLDVVDRLRRVNQDVKVETIAVCRANNIRTLIAEDGRTAHIASRTGFSHRPNSGQTSKMT